ncbi:MAG TPA: nucleotidyltransferase family protein [Solirubrobacteraceae bacterium]|jgi:hypothetical protein|nr:nucleotidyltransferase family protein [Solirubrobacteraceae bacterium]
MSALAAADILTEAQRLSAAAEQEATPVRLLGGVAIALRCPSAQQPPLKRTYGDIDLVARSRDRRKLQRFLAGQGYRGLDQLNAVHGGSRLFFYDEVNQRKLDVFIDRFEMCHELDLRPRLGLAGPTLSLADLLLTKLQVVETTEKDLRDIVAVFADHDFTDDDEGINLPYLVNLTGSDWGLWQTVTQVAERAGRFASGLGGFGRAAERAARLVEVLADAPKTAGWRVRARVGGRVRWYKLPEEPDFS